MRIRFTIDITRSDNHSPPWPKVFPILVDKVFPILVDMFLPKKEQETPLDHPSNIVCHVDGHMFGGGLHCARCGMRNATPS